MPGGNNSNNNNGNSSITNEFHNWKYFNSSMDKLGRTKATPINLSTNRLVTPEQQNWLETIGKNLTKGMEAYWNGRTEIGKKKAEKFIAEHGIEEYLRLMKENKVPFQDDPFAMACLSQNNAKIVKNLIDIDFQNEIKKGTFKNLSEAELDTKYHEYLQNGVQEVAGLYGFDTDDYFFKQGLYSNSPETRMQMITLNKEVGNKELSRQYREGSVAQSSDIINNSNLPYEEQIRRLDLIYKTGEPHFTLEDSVSYRDGILELIKGSKNGAELIQAMAKTPMAMFEGKNLTQIYGSEGVDTLSKQAKRIQTESDIKGWARWRDSIDELERKMDIPALTKLYEDELSPNKIAKDSSKVEYLRKALDRAQENLKKEGAKAEKARQTAVLSDEYLKNRQAQLQRDPSALSDKAMRVKMKGTGFSSTEANYLDEQFINQKLASDTPEEIGNLIRMATENPIVGSSFSEAFASVIKDNSSSLERAIAYYKANGEIDPNKHPELYADVPIKDAKGNTTHTVKMPKALGFLQNINNASKGSLKVLLGDAKYEKLLTRFYQMQFAISQGQDPIAWIASGEIAMEEQESKRQAESAPKYSISQPKFKASQFADSDTLFNTMTDIRAPEGVQLNAYRANVYAYAKMLLKNNPRKTLQWREAVSEAEKLVRDEMALIAGGCMINKSLISKDYSENQYRNALVSLTGAKDSTDLLKNYNITSSDLTREIVVASIDGNYVKTFSYQELGNRTKSLVDGTPK